MGCAVFHRIYTGGTVDLKRRVAEHRTTLNPSTKPFTNRRTGVTRSVQQLNDDKKKKSTLAAHVWEVRANNLIPTVEWFIQQRSIAYKPGDHWCGICLGETTLICFADPNTTLNKRSELWQGCRHKWKYKLGNKVHGNYPCTSWFGNIRALTLYMRTVRVRVRKYVI